jgi:uncharacterized membrane protein
MSTFDKYKIEIKTEVTWFWISIFILALGIMGGILWLIISGD